MHIYSHLLVQIHRDALKPGELVAASFQECAT